VSNAMLRQLILKTLAEEIYWKLAITIIDFRTVVNKDGHEYIEIVVKEVNENEDEQTPSVKLWGKDLLRKEFLN
jgi:hypothetical protein